MTIEETKGVLEILKVAYPNSFTNVNEKEFVKLWYGGLKKYDLKIVLDILNSIIYHEEREFAPKIAMVINRIESLKEKELTELEAWSLVSKALEKSGYHAEEEFKKLPEQVRSVVGSPDTLREWCMLDSYQVSTVIASNFQRSYRARAKWHKENKYISLETKQTLMLESLADSFKLENK